MSLHRQRTHPDFVDGCFACKLSTLAVSPSATPSRRGGSLAAAHNLREQGWKRDMDAYKRLREDGFQPKAIDGAADIEARAETRFEIESGRVYDDQKALGAAVDQFESTFERGVFTPAPPKPIEGD